MIDVCGKEIVRSDVVVILDDCKICFGVVVVPKFQGECKVAVFDNNIETAVRFVYTANSERIFKINIAQVPAELRVEMSKAVNNYKLTTHLEDF